MTKPYHIALSGDYVGEAFLLLKRNYSIVRLGEGNVRLCLYFVNNPGLGMLSNSCLSFLLVSRQEIRIGRISMIAKVFPVYGIMGDA